MTIGQSSTLQQLIFLALSTNLVCFQLIIVVNYHFETLKKIPFSVNFKLAKKLQDYLRAGTPKASWTTDSEVRPEGTKRKRMPKSRDDTP